MGVKCELYRDNFQNFKSYGIPKAQLILTDIPYNLGDRMYGSNPMWYEGGDMANGESSLAHKAAFHNDNDTFYLPEFLHYAGQMLRKEPGKGEKDAPCIVCFCAFEQMHNLIDAASKNGFAHAYPLIFIKPSSPQALKANMKIVGATEYGVVLYRNKLPKFRNVDADGKHRMIKNWFEFRRDGKDIPRVHPTQKPVNLLRTLIEIFTDPGDVVIDPCAGSGSTLRAARDLGRNSYGFEVIREFYEGARSRMLA